MLRFVVNYRMCHANEWAAAHGPTGCTLWFIPYRDVMTRGVPLDRFSSRRFSSKSVCHAVRSPCTAAGYRVVFVECVHSV